MTRRLQTIKRKMMADREVRAAYDALAGEFDLARELIAARSAKRAQWKRRVSTATEVTAAVAKLERRC